MKRLIDAEALKELFVKTLENIKSNPRMTGQERHIIATIHTVGQMIDDSPTVDAVPVIRCRDCKYYGNVIFSGTQFEYGECRLISKLRASTDYCSWAEPKENNE